MSRSGKSKKPLFFLLLIPIVIAGLSFVFRPPVLLVTDLVYDQLYGRFRGMKAQAGTSLRLFRRVKTVRIAENAGPDVVVFAVNSASEKPFCVLFPYRYYREAEQYAGEYPAIPTVVLLGRVREFPAEDSGLMGIRTDTGADYFKMGRAAAVFARYRNEENAGEVVPGKVLFLRDDLVSPEDMEAFQRGLRAEEYSLAPIDIRSGNDYTVPGDVGCAILTGAADFFFSQNLGLPVLLFSWLDPALTTSTVKVILDDSPWSQVIPAVAIASGKRKNEAIPSKALILKKRIPEKEFLMKAEGIFREVHPDL
jgi:hypothetical protein